MVIAEIPCARLEVHLWAFSLNIPSLNIVIIDVHLFDSIPPIFHYSVLPNSLLAPQTVVEIRHMARVVYYTVNYIDVSLPSHLSLVISLRVTNIANQQNCISVCFIYYPDNILNRITLWEQIDKKWIRHIDRQQAHVTSYNYINHLYSRSHS